MMHDLINDAIVNIKNHERIGRSECLIRPSSKLLIEILKVFQKEGYIGEFELSEDNRGSGVRVKLNRKINDCGVIKPRHNVKRDEFPDWEKRFLPSRNFGILVVSTPKGVMNHKDAMENGVGGRLLVYVY